MKPYRYIKQFIFCIGLSSAALPSAAQEADDWWFDVEIFIFKRELTVSVDENFDLEQSSLKTTADRNLLILPALKILSPGYDIFRTLPDCNPAPPIQLLKVEDVEIIEFQDAFLDEQEDELVYADKVVEETVMPSQPLPSLQVSEVVKQDINLRCFDGSLPDPILEIPSPLTIDGEYDAGNERVMGQQHLTMTEFVERIRRQPDIIPMLHTAWRQKVEFGENNADFFALLAGQKLIIPEKERLLDETIYSQDLQQDTTFLDVITGLKAALNQPNAVDWSDYSRAKMADSASTDSLDKVFEVEGRFKVYLEYINRIPYLHIDADVMHHRLLMDANSDAYIQAYPFKQRRRIISKQIHYFDHPAFGMVVRLERYEPPIEELSAVEGASE